MADLLSDVADPEFGRIDLDTSIHGMAKRILSQLNGTVNLAGHSLGGIVALQIVGIAPHRVRRLALLNTSARPPNEAQIRMWSEQGRRLALGEFPSLAAEHAGANLPPGAPREVVELVERGALGIGPTGFLRQLRAQATRPDARPTLSSITAPVLVLSGQVDQVCLPDLQREIAQAIPGSQHVVLEAAGHMSIIERPRCVAAQLRAWLARPASPCQLPHIKENS